MPVLKISKPLDGALPVIALAAAALITTTFHAPPAVGQEREPPPGITVEVTPKSWLNPPDNPVEGSLPGSMRQQVIIDTYIARDSAFIGRPDDFGESVLPRFRGPDLNSRTID